MKISARKKFDIAVSYYAPDAKPRKIAADAGISPDTLNAWRHRLEDAASLIFGHGGFYVTAKRIESERDQLQERVEELVAILNRAGIPIPSKYNIKVHSDREDEDLLEKFDDEKDKNPTFLPVIPEYEHPTRPQKIPKAKKSSARF